VRAGWPQEKKGEKRGRKRKRKKKKVPSWIPIGMHDGTFFFAAGFEGSGATSSTQ
jgi:hypothetical protein